MSKQNWDSRDRKSTAKRYLKHLGKPFRKLSPKDSKQSREWAKSRKQLRRLEEEELREGVE